MNLPIQDQVLDEQLAYYRARAPEYDRWFLREGRYDRGAAATAAWRAELDEVRTLLHDTVPPGADVLELASGTGIWTAELTDLGACVTAVDAAPEMLAQMQTRLEGRGIVSIEADLFRWSPPRTFDAVVSCFFMSHVPDERFDGFASLLARCLRGGGALFLLDSLAEGTSTAADHVLPDASTQLMVRRLDDGRAFTIVKRFRAPDELAASLEAHGMAVEVHQTSTYFQVVTGSLA